MVAAATARGGSVGKINLCGRVRLNQVRIFLMRGDKGEEEHSDLF